MLWLAILLFGISASMSHAISSSHCPTGFIDLGENGCYLFVTNKTFVSNWVEATNLCQDLGGHLAELTTQSQIDVVAEMAAFTESLTGISQWWIGLSDLGLEGEFRWQGSGLIVEQSSWTSKRPNMEPFNRDDCVSLAKQFDKENTFFWVDSGCEELKAPLCQASDPATTTTSSTSTEVTTETVSSTVKTTTTEKTTTMMTECPEEWLLFNHHCYKVFTTYVTFSKGEDNCIREGGHLISVESEQEQDVLEYLLVTLGSAYTWIGGKDEEVEGEWMWIDGSEWSYSNWDNENPNGGYLKNCINTRYSLDGKWRDAPCYDTYMYICEIHLANS